MQTNEIQLLKGIDMRRLQLQLELKGDRQYLHGTSLISAVHESLGPDTSSCSVAFHRFMHQQPDLFVTEGLETIVMPSDPAMEFHWQVGAGLVHGWMIESDRPIESRVDYPEKKLWLQARLDGDCVRGVVEHGFTAIDTVVSLTKLLHNRRFPLQDKKWFFTKLDCSSTGFLRSAALVQIELERNLHNRITRSRVICDGKPVAAIFFSST